MMATTVDPSGTFLLPSILKDHGATTSPILIAQGAEGRLYKTTYLTPALPCALKYRPSKPWRHPVLDAKLTRQRILAEARIIAKCRREGVLVPALYTVNEAAGWLMLEWIEGGTVRARINEWLERRQQKATTVDSGNLSHQTPGRSDNDDELVDLLHKMGAAVATLHQAGMVHGDLTTSNMILRSSHQGHNSGGTNDLHTASLHGHVVLIDFGLASQTSTDEDRAVDLYVLERAFGSTHPAAESSFGAVLVGYKQTFRKSETVLKKLQDVRMRGRKRSMIG